MFRMKYEIKQDYITVGTKRRSGARITNHLFGVAHDTGNSGSTAQNNVDYYKRTARDMSASAHAFIDDKNIIECIPPTEKAWHVLYDVKTDNFLFGDDANDTAIGVELCFGGKINFEEAYKRYVWYCAYVSYKYGFNKWVGHEKLDPARKTDPSNALKRYGKTYEGLLIDIQREYEECTRLEPLKSVIEKEENDLNEVETTALIKKVLAEETKKRQELGVSDWASEDWKRAVDAGYFDGPAPRDYLTKEQAAGVNQRVIGNIRKFVVAPLEERIKVLEEKLKGAE